MIATLEFGCHTCEMVLPSTGQVTILREITFQLNTDLSTDPPVFTLTCTSTGGPATTVSWRKDGTVLSDDSNHDITSRVTDPVTATYTNTLTVTGRLPGQYDCSVSNSRTPSRSTRSSTVVGKKCNEHTCLVWIKTCACEGFFFVQLIICSCMHAQSMSFTTIIFLTQRLTHPLT